MLLNFRQGIQKKATASMLQLSGNSVDLISTQQFPLISFAHRDEEYLFREPENVIGAWSFAPGDTVWLFWDIDTNTGERSFGTTQVEPQFGTSLPTNPSDNLHFFLTGQRAMFVWENSTWVNKIRVFAGKVENGITLTEEGEGSQVGLNEKILAGYLLFNEHGPFKVQKSSRDFYFVTSETTLISQDNPLNEYKLEFNAIRAMTISPIPEGHGVSWVDRGEINMSSNTTPQFPCVGICKKSVGPNELTSFVTDGYLESQSFDFDTSEYGKPLWIGSNGELTTTTPKKYSIQKVGTVVDRNTVFVNIEPLVSLDIS
jgi:hypothetical protein